MGRLFAFGVLLLAIGFPTAACAQGAIAQTFKFSGLIWGSGVSEVRSQLADSGFRDIRHDSDGDFVFDGELFGHKTLGISVFAGEKGLARVIVVLATPAPQARKQYEVLRDFLVKKYGPSAETVASFESPFRNGDGMEQQAIQLGKATVASRWLSSSNEVIALRIEKNLSVRLDYDAPSYAAYAAAKGATGVASPARTASGVSRSPLALRKIGLISEVLSLLNGTYLFQVDYPSLLRGAVRGLNSGLLDGKLTVSEDGNGLNVAVAAKGAQLRLGKATSAQEAQDQLVRVRNLAHEIDPSIDTFRIEEAMLQGGVTALDPHSNFLTREAFKDLQVGTSGPLGGLGIDITMREGWPMVVSPIEGTPAMRSGLQPRDRIASIDGLATFNLQLQEITKQLVGAPATRVMLGIQREGWDTPRNFPIDRELIRVQSVRSRELEPGIAYIRINQFQQGTPQLLQDVLDRLTSAGAMRGLVLDLRNDPGGLISSVVDVAGKFLPDGQLVLTSDSTFSEDRLKLMTKSSGRRNDAPMVVLVNEGSASGSEILAGALQDWKRAVVVGNRTFGKGTVQTIVTISGGYAVRLTTGAYRTPKGRGFHATGIDPDLSLPGVMPVAGDGTEDVQLQGAVKRLKQLIENK